MKKMIEKLKKSSLFCKLMLTYSFLLIIAVICLLVWEWGALEDYQSDYDTRYAEAEEKASKGNITCIEEYVAQYTKELHGKLLLENLKNDSLFYTSEEFAQYKLNQLDFNNISYKKNDKNYTETRPVYDILAGEEIIATVTLGVGEIDEFGFNSWKINGTSVDASVDASAKVELVVENGMKVYIGEKEVPDTFITETKTIAKNIYDRIVKLTGVEEKLYVYKVEGLLNEDDLKVVDEAGSEIMYVENDGVRQYISRPDEAITKECTEYADVIVKAYINYTNRWSTMNQMLAYTVNGSAAASAIKRADASVVFTRKPSKIDYTSRVIDNIHKVSEDLFYCDVDYKIQKIVYGKPVDECIKFTLLIRKQGGSWLLEDMAYNE